MIADMKKAREKRTITICSSASFYKQVLEAKTFLEQTGFKVLIPLVARDMEKNKDFRVERYKTWFKKPDYYKRKKFLTKKHFEKVIRGDITLVLNYEKNGVPGYVGGAVLMEMAIALHHRKPIYLLNPIPKSVSYKEELLGMSPMILDGDLANIK